MHIFPRRFHHSDPSSSFSRTQLQPGFFMLSAWVSTSVAVKKRCKMKFRLRFWCLLLSGTLTCDSLPSSLKVLDQNLDGKPVSSFRTWLEIWNNWGTLETCFLLTVVIVHLRGIISSSSCLWRILATTCISPKESFSPTRNRVCVLSRPTIYCVLMLRLRL